MRIVLDSNILVRSFVSSHGLAHDLLLTILSRDHTLILSNEMLSEVARVLRYPRLMAVHGENERRSITSPAGCGMRRRSLRSILLLMRPFATGMTSSFCELH